MLSTAAGTSKYMKQIKEIIVDSYFDLCCKVSTLLFSLASYFAHLIQVNLVIGSTISNCVVCLGVVGNV